MCILPSPIAVWIVTSQSLNISLPVVTLSSEFFMLNYFKWKLVFVAVCSGTEFVTVQIWWYWSLDKRLWHILSHLLNSCFIIVKMQSVRCSNCHMCSILLCAISSHVICNVPVSNLATCLLVSSKLDPWWFVRVNFCCV